MLVGPIEAPGNDASVGRSLLQVWLLLVQRVRRPELAAVQGGAVANHDLRRVFVGHNHGGLR